MNPFVDSFIVGFDILRDVGISTMLFQRGEVTVVSKSDVSSVSAEQLKTLGWTQCFHHWTLQNQSQST